MTMRLVGLAALPIGLLASTSRPAAVVSAMATDGRGVGVVVWAAERSESRLQIARFGAGPSAMRMAVGKPSVGLTTTDSILAVAVDVDEQGRMVIGWQARTATRSIVLWGEGLASDGSVEWGPTEVAPDVAVAPPAVVADGLGGGYFAFGVDADRSVANDAVEIRRVAAEGKIVWALALAAERAQFRNPQLVGDEVGGAIVVFEARVLDGAGEGDRHLLAQRISPDGQSLWGDGETFVPFAATNYDEYGAALVPDGGGVIAAFESVITAGPYAGNANIAAQRLTADGRQAWGSGGIPAWVSATTAQERRPAVASDGHGGAVIAFEGSLGDEAASDIWAQRMSADGAALWGTQGLPVALTSTPQSEMHPRVALTMDGAIAVGYDALGVSPAPTVCLNLVSVDGRYAWPRQQALPADGEGLSLMHLWGGTNATVHVVTNSPTLRAPVAIEHWAVNADGAVLDEPVDVTAVAAQSVQPEVSVLPASPNPFNAVTTFTFWSVASRWTEIQIVNPLGQTVRHISHAAVATGWQRVTWDGRDDAGSPAASGVYIYSIRNVAAPAHGPAAGTLSGRVTLAR